MVLNEVRISVVWCGAGADQIRSVFQLPAEGSTCSGSALRVYNPSFLLSPSFSLHHTIYLCFSKRHLCTTSWLAASSAFLNENSLTENHDFWPGSPSFKTICFQNTFSIIHESVWNLLLLYPRTNKKTSPNFHVVLLDPLLLLV